MSELIRVLLIPVDGPARFETVLPGLETMQRFVEGDIEGVGYRDGGSAYGHGEGKFVHEHNPHAHAFLVDYFNHFDGDQIHGPIVILGVDDEGCDISIPDDLVWAASVRWSLTASA